MAAMLLWEMNGSEEMTLYALSERARCRMKGAKRAVVLAELVYDDIKELLREPEAGHDTSE